MSRSEIISAYRQMYRHLMRAIRYTKPQVYIARRQLRSVFQPVPGTREYGKAFDAEGVQRTIWFFQAAERVAGLEHRVLKNLLMVAGVRGELEKMPWKAVMKGKKPEMQRMVEHAYAHYDRTIEMLNKTMGLRLK